MKEIETLVEFQAEITAGAVVVDFFAPWCGPCKLLLPRLEKLAAVKTDVKFIKVDVDKLPAVAERYRVRSVPSLVLLRDGQPVREFPGAMADQALAKEIA